MGKKRQKGEKGMEQLKNASADSRKKSLVETSLDIFLGFLMFLPVNYFVLPLLPDPIAEYNILTAIQIGVMFSIFLISLQPKIEFLFGSFFKIVF